MRGVVICWGLCAIKYAIVAQNIGWLEMIVRKDPASRLGLFCSVSPRVPPMLHGYYNPTRRYSTIGYKCPIDFEREAGVA
jgi:hypothetical protein